MLSGFLGDELSESHLGVPPGLRAHLERFRSFLLSYYTTRFSYYPPRVFKPSLCNTMRDDFEALYKLLADDSYSASECLPSVACGGICTLQLVQMFDAKHGYESLDNPLPLLPQFNQKSSSRRMPWRARIERLLPDQKLLAHTALIKASNWRDKVFHNDLVKAYRKFEEDSVYTAAKADKQEKVSLVDARKVRWILIYATCQVLRSVTDIPDEVFDAGEAPYHVAISTKYLPPWSETAIDFGNLVRRQTELAVQTSPSIYWADSAGTVDNSGKIEIKPDIDYFALTHQELTPTERTRPGLASSVMTSTPPTRSNSVARGLSRNGTIRRSMRMFKPAAAERPQEAMALSKPPYHQIVVQGYGNGLNYLSLESGSQTVETVETVETTETTTTPLWAVRNNSTLSHSGSSGQASAPGSTDSGDTLESTIVTPTTLTGFSNYALQPESKPSRSQKRDVVSMLLGPSRTNSSNGNSIKRPVSSAMPGSRASSNMNFDGNGANNYSDIYEQLVDEQRQSFFSGEGDASVSLKRTSQQPRFVVDDDWAAMQAFMDGSETPTDGDKRDVKPAWEQYADLGGLTEMRSSVAV